MSFFEERTFSGGGDTYEVVRKLGQGAFGEVRGQEASLKRNTAV